MALSLEDIDRELAARESGGSSAIEEVDAELKRRGIDASSLMSQAGPVVKEGLKRVATAAFPEVATAVQAAQTPAIANPAEAVLGMPERGLQGLAISATSGLQRGAEATKPGFDPQGVKENLASLAASFADPRALAMNPAAGEAISAAKNVAAPTGAFLGKQAARAVQALTGVPQEDVLMTAKKPLEVLFSKLPSKSGKIFQKAKEAAGVTEAEERLVAGIGDPSGFKAVADKMQRKFEKYGPDSLTIGEALAWKKAATSLARSKQGSAIAIYSKDAEKAQSILKEKAPEVVETQSDVALSKAREAFSSILPRNKGKTPAVMRTLAAGGAAAINPLAALAFSPLLAALPATLATGGAIKGLNKLSESPAIRQALLSVLQTIKDNQGSK